MLILLQNLYQAEEIIFACVFGLRVKEYNRIDGENFELKGWSKKFALGVITE